MGLRLGPGGAGCPALEQERADEDADAAKRLPKLPAYAAELAAFLDGDLWRGSAGWIGELPADAEALISMGRGIVSENVLQELLTRHVAAFLGKEPRWGLVATTAGTTPQPADPMPTSLSFTPDGSAILVVCAGESGGALVRIDVATRQVTHRVAAAGPIADALAVGMLPTKR